MSVAAIFNPQGFSQYCALVKAITLTKSAPSLFCLLKPSVVAKYFR